MGTRAQGPTEEEGGGTAATHPSSGRESGREQTGIKQQLQPTGKANLSLFSHKFHLHAVD